MKMAIFYIEIKTKRGVTKQLYNIRNDTLKETNYHFTDFHPFLLYDYGVNFIEEIIIFSIQI